MDSVNHSGKQNVQLSYRYRQTLVRMDSELQQQQEPNSNDLFRFSHRVYPCEVLKPSDDDQVTIKAVVTVTVTAGGFLSTIGLTRHLEDLGGKTFLLELVSADLHPSKLALNCIHSNFIHHKIKQLN